MGACRTHSQTILTCIDNGVPVVFIVFTSLGKNNGWAGTAFLSSDSTHRWSMNAFSGQLKCKKQHRLGEK